MFEVGDGAFIASGGADAAGDAGEDVVVELVELDLLPAVQFIAFELHAVLVSAQVTAVEQEQHLVALPLVGRPVYRDEPVGGALEAELLGDLAAAGGDGRRRGTRRTRRSRLGCPRCRCRWGGRAAPGRRRRGTGRRRPLAGW